MNELNKRVKFIMDMPVDLNKKIESYAKSKGIWKSAVVKIAVSKFLDQEEIAKQKAVV
jgi:hypothetical protein